MVSMKPKTAEQYVHPADQAIIEVDEFIACLEFDMEGANKLNTRLPFAHMLALNNDTHRYGLDIDTDS